MKCRGLTPELHPKLIFLSEVDVEVEVVVVEVEVVVFEVVVVVVLVVSETGSPETG